MATSARRDMGSHRRPAGMKRTLALPKPPIPARSNGRTAGPSASALIQELGTCVTEADLVQVLYRGLQRRFGYNAINLQVLEREGWYHSLPIDAGVLQDIRRRPLSESMFAGQFANPRTTVLPLESTQQEKGKGPGARVKSRLAIWVPVRHQGELIGSIIYHTDRKRRVSPDRKSTRLNSSHGSISYAVFCLKKKKQTYIVFFHSQKKKKTKINI